MKKERKFGLKEFPRPLNIKIGGHFTMNKTNTTESSLNMIKSVCAERDRKERDRLMANRIEMDKRDEAERERVQQSSNLLNSYIEKAMEIGRASCRERV